MTEWKHGYSELGLMQFSNNMFQFIDQSNGINFPKVTVEELVNEIKNHDAGENWENIARKCSSIHKLPCTVVPSKYIFIIKKKINNQWESYAKLTLIPPMGC